MCEVYQFKDCLILSVMALITFFFISSRYLKFIFSSQIHLEQSQHGLKKTLGSQRQLENLAQKAKIMEKLNLVEWEWK